jgi:hypothetical protein
MNVSKYTGQWRPGRPPPPRNFAEPIRPLDELAADPKVQAISQHMTEACLCCGRQPHQLAAVGVYILGRSTVGGPLIGSCLPECAHAHLIERHLVGAWRWPEREPGVAELAHHRMAFRHAIADLTLGLLDEDESIHLEATHWPPGLRTTLYSPRIIHHG